MITCLEIIETGNILLLTDKEDPTPEEIENLAQIWIDLYDQYKNKYDPQNQNKIFNATKEIEYLANKYDEIGLIVEALKFDKDERLIDILRNYGYRFEISTYIDDLKRVNRESKGIIQKINVIKNSLPKEDKNDNRNISDTTISSMASYSSILGYDFDFYTISVEKFHALESQVKKKVEAIEKQNAKK